MSHIGNTNLQTQKQTYTVTTEHTKYKHTQSVNKMQQNIQQSGKRTLGYEVHTNISL